MVPILEASRLTLRNLQVSLEMEYPSLTYRLSFPRADIPILRRQIQALRARSREQRLLWATILLRNRYPICAKPILRRIS